LNQTGDFWFVENDMGHIRGRFAFSQVSPGGAAFGSVLVVEPFEWRLGVALRACVSCDEVTSTIPLSGNREIQCSRDNMSDLAIEFPLSRTSCSYAAL
jgi:hypothetical protein